MELLKLQKEVRELRQQNFERQKNIRYIPFNIISNNLYINNSLNKTSINSNFPKNNNIYSSLISNKEIQKKKQFEQKKKMPFGKLPLQKGMFSYKTTLNNNYLNYININRNYNNKNELYRNSSQKEMKINKQNYYNNNINSNSLLSAELKLNLDDNINGDNSTPSKIGMGNRVMSSSSLNLNKYRINKKNIINQKKNIITPSFQEINLSNRALNISENDYKNNNNKSLNENQMLNIKQNQNENKNNLTVIVETKKKKVRKVADHFKNNPKNEQESRRMIIELIKILNRQKYKNKKIYASEDIDNVLKKNNISKKVLNKEYNLEDLNSWNAFNNSDIFMNSKEISNNNNNLNSKRNLLNNNSFDGNTLSNYKETNSNNNSKIISKKLITPFKKNINNFLTKMNDAKKDKINIIAFLSIPRIMNLYYLNQKYTYIFILSPSDICYRDGIESYIFKFADIETKQFVGGFDLIKVKICSKIRNKPNNFYIETFNGKIKRNYEIETKSLQIADNYVKYINYLSQLIKCKVYDLKSVYKE